MEEMKNKKNIKYLGKFAKFWYELWYPGKAAALEAEQNRHKAIIEANQKHNELEAQMSLLLTQMQIDYENDMHDLYQNLGLIGVFGIIIYLLLK
ncbi:MAG TPA: hypothetical protein PLL02_00985 [Bacteroidales bacterium]|nr:hypothetical protein [Bacteroidales bacterium]